MQATGTEPQSQAHIKPLHWYAACRLVIEGGFDPDDVTPRPPFRVEQRGRRRRLVHDQSLASGAERTVLGGLKTKDVDVVVTKNGIGPCLAISHKGSLGAFRNLTNRMEEAVGDCTNIHIAYPALVYGYLVVIRANRGEARAVEAARDLVDVADEISASTEAVRAADMAVREGGEPAEMVLRFHQALRDLTMRRGIRDDVSRYEAVAMTLVDPSAERRGEILADIPRPDSPLRFERFFSDLYARYDERFVYGAPRLKTTTERHEWSPDSPIFQPLRDPSWPALDYEPRVAVS